MPQIGPASPPAEWLSESPTPDEITEILQFLTDQGTFNFPTLSSGLFSAAAAENPEFRITGYQNVWVRDNIHIAHALWVCGEQELAAQALRSFVQFYTKHAQRFTDIISGKVSAAIPQQRPHIRFDGESLTENDEQWAHAQNDALGYLLWLLCKLLRSGDLAPDQDVQQVLGLLVRYLHAIRYWQDEDSGHWEETRKIEASSIGAVVAGLRELNQLLTEQPQLELHLPPEVLATALTQGEQALRQILPAECIQPDPKQHRRYDAALLFLCYPLQVVDAAMEKQISRDIREQLLSPIGIKRYSGDSYWCANYRDLLSVEKRTTDYSEDTSGRDALLKPGEEAQWCIFDPILSVVHGRRYLQSGNPADFELQVTHLRRSLAQLTTADSRFGAYRCPESYFLEHGEWIPNDICPLLWTQANLRLALHWMKQVAEQQRSQH